MAKRIFEFICTNNHLFDRYIDDEQFATSCPHCNANARRIISIPRIDLDGCSGDFPTASDAWVKKRESHMKYERKMGIGDAYRSEVEV